MNPPELTLAPVTEPLVGGTASSLRLALRNGGPEVERYELVAVGPLSSWTTLDDAELRIWPGESRETTVTVLFPPATAPPAGTSEVGVMAIAGDGTWAEARHPVEVAARPQVVLHTPAPPAVRTCRRAQVHLAVANAGNVPLAVALSARDRQGSLVQDSPPATARLALAPGQAFTVPVVLRCVRIAWFGDVVPRDYTVEATAGQATASSAGVVAQDPLLRKWWLVVLAAVIALAVAAEGFIEALAVLVVVLAVLMFAVLVVVRYVRVVRRGPGRR